MYLSVVVAFSPSKSAYALLVQEGEQVETLLSTVESFKAEIYVISSTSTTTFSVYCVLLCSGVD